MRVVYAALVAVIAALAGSLPALAQTAVAAVETGPQADLPLGEHLMSAIIRNVEERAALATDPMDRTFLSQLAGHYRMQGINPMWVDGRGLRPEGDALYQELSKADHFGLDPALFALPAMPVTASSVNVLASTEIDLSFSAVEYAWHARGGRVDPSQLSRWLDQHPRTLYVSDVFRAIEAHGDAVAALRSYHPKHPEFERLRQAYLEERGIIVRTQPLVIPAGGPALVLNARHADVPLLRQRLKKPAATPERNDLLDGELLYAVREFMYENGYGRVRVVDDRVRAALSRPTVLQNANKKALLDKYVVNLERWRWMPEDMGELHVWNNLPEFETRVVRDGNVIHQERIVIGKPNTQTPIFSDAMSHVIFQPEWGVPESIKISSLLPHLRGGDLDVLSRRNMKISFDGRVVKPSRYNWSKIDIRNIPIVQGAGPGNPLGRLKFIFPNGHDVYMHDTPDKHLFNDNERTFSHGCIRVRNPQRFAEVVLGEVEGWAAVHVANQLKRKETRQVDLRQHIPVHNTYFTIRASEDGTVKQLKDVYAHDRRISEALAGKSIKLIASRDPAIALWKHNQELRKNVALIRPKSLVSAKGVKRPKPGSLFAAARPPKPFPAYGRQGLTKYRYYGPPPSSLWFKF
jgi:L,D-transpeptidase YcbB